MVSSVAEFKPRIMCHLLGPHFLVFALTKEIDPNWEHNPLKSPNIFYVYIYNSYKRGSLEKI